jgi:hypothetical protein
LKHGFTILSNEDEIMDNVYDEMEARMAEEMFWNDWKSKYLSNSASNQKSEEERYYSVESCNIFKTISKELLV